MSDFELYEEVNGKPISLQKGAVPRKIDILTAVSNQDQTVMSFYSFSMYIKYFIYKQMSPQTAVYFLYIRSNRMIFRTVPVQLHPGGA